jgi:hypothetical protein
MEFGNMCRSALVQIFYSVDLRGNGDLLEKMAVRLKKPLNTLFDGVAERPHIGGLSLLNCRGWFEQLRRAAAEPQFFCFARLPREEPDAREWPGRMFGDMMQCTSDFSTTLKACYLLSL